MKPLPRLLLGLLCIYLIANALTLLWTAHHEVFPTFPQAWADRLATLYRARHAEDVANLEGLVGFALFTPVATAIYLGIRWAIAKIRHRRRR
ncbi:hypothetical protein [Burkholderia guangdongensis]|uniref:hypothetical protein n=1 Tax=Burkholderia guangdongensis TaxID=1792500 RepID=UPI0015CA80E9|nr:hypothetical protein [Burkholderia guangdongensis]